MPSLKVSTNGHSIGHDPQLINVIGYDIEKLGLVGEENNALLVYICFTSRLLPDPMRLIAMGESGIGKSNVLERVSELMPPKVVVRLDSLTNAALFNNADKNRLVHKILICGERKHSQDDQSRDESRYLRQLLSEHVVTREKCEGPDQHGKINTVIQERKGPIAYCESTTLSDKVIFPEDLNRMLPVFMDKSNEQSRRILHETALQYERGESGSSKKTIIATHRAFQKSLQKYEVKIPYACAVAKQIPSNQIKVRRISKQIWSAISAITLLHQFQRKTDSEGYLIATEADYEVARRLLIGPLQRSLGVADSAAEYEAIREKLTDKFTSEEFGKASGKKAKSTRNELIAKYVDLGSIELVKKGTGNKPNHYRWTGKTPNNVLLPSVEAIFATERPGAAVGMPGRRISLKS